VRIGILGGGRVGSALAATWRAAGHEVTVSTRETLAETAAASDVLLLAVPASAAADVLGTTGSLDGKVLIDATNNVSGGPDGATIATLAREARVVKTFNTTFATFYNATPPERPATMVLCGDDADAKAIVSELVRDAGFDPVDLGGHEQSADVEAFARLVIGLAYRQARGAFVYRFEQR
jgi:predicted dinucleotide-binding enzyme